MQSTRTFGSIAAVTAFAAVIFLANAHPARGTDLQDTQTLVNHPAADITDVYAFPAPDNANNVVLVMNVNPLIPTEQGGSVSFDPNVLYQFQISHNAAGSGTKASADTVIQFAANVGNSSQTLTMYGPAAPNANSPSVSTVVPTTASATIPYNQPTKLNAKDAAGNPIAVQVFAGTRADPDFFDLARFYSLFPDRYYGNHQTTAAIPASSPSPPSFRGFMASASACDQSVPIDYFSSGKYNVLSIVLELPKSALAIVPSATPGAPSNNVNVWATTSTVTGV